MPYDKVMYHLTLTRFLLNESKKSDHHVLSDVSQAECGKDNRYLVHGLSTGTFGRDSSTL